MVYDTQITSNNYLVGGWALPLWKMMEWVRQLGWWPIYGKIQNVPNHQPVTYVHVSVSSNSRLLSSSSCYLPSSLSSHWSAKKKLMMQYFQYLSSVLITRSAGGVHILRCSLAFFWRCPTSHGATPSELRMVSWKIRKKMDDSGVPPTSIYKLATNESPYSQSVAHMWIPLVMTNIDIENRPSIVDYAINLY